jgi:hypothetical protein
VPTNERRAQRNSVSSDVSHTAASGMDSPRSLRPFGSTYCSFKGWCKTQIFKLSVSVMLNRPEPAQMRNWSAKRFIVWNLETAIDLNSIHMLMEGDGVIKSLLRGGLNALTLVAILKWSRLYGAQGIQKAVEGKSQPSRRKHKRRQAAILQSGRFSITARAGV